MQFSWTQCLSLHDWKPRHCSAKNPLTSACFWRFSRLNWPAAACKKRPAGIASERELRTVRLAGRRGPAARYCHQTWLRTAPSSSAHTSQQLFTVSNESPLATTLTTLSLLTKKWKKWADKSRSCPLACHIMPLSMICQSFGKLVKSPNKTDSVLLVKCPPTKSW